MKKKVELLVGLLLLLQFRKEEGRASSWLLVVGAIQEEGKRTCCWKRWLPKTYSFRLECHDPKPDIVL
jgi:hypothetical protein